MPAVKPVLILQHQTPEWPAYLATWLDQHNIAYTTFNAGAGQQFPASIEPYSALAVMGGGMSSNDPLLSNRQAEILILQAMHWNVPVIGHCLGGQLMTRALGGTVGPSPQPEIGWQSINYDHPELAQHWFGPNATPTVIHWHYEAFSVPTGAVRVASSPSCPNQAWALGPHLAMQFHIEIDVEKVHAWVNDEDPKWAAAQSNYTSVQDKHTILAGIEPYLSQHQATADHVYTRWLTNTCWTDRL